MICVNPSPSSGNLVHLTGMTGIVDCGLAASMQANYYCHAEPPSHP